MSKNGLYIKMCHSWWGLHAAEEIFEAEGENGKEENFDIYGSSHIHIATYIILLCS